MTKFENQKLIQKASIKFVEERMLPKDFMAVFILGSGLRLLTDFTNDKPKLIEALKKTDLAGSAIAYDRATLNSNIEAGQSPLMQFQESSIGSTPSGQNATAVAAALASRLQSLGTAIIAQHVASLDVALRSGLDRRQSLGVLSAIRAIAAGVKTIEGRKTLMLFSEGFVVGPSVEDELHSVTAFANRSQLAVYCIESQGLETRELRGIWCRAMILAPPYRTRRIIKFPEEVRPASIGHDRPAVTCVKARCGIFPMQLEDSLFTILTT